MSATSLQQPAVNNIFLQSALFVGFIITGIVATILGPILPIFIARWNMPDSTAGLFFTIVFGGSLLGVGLSSVIQAWRGYRDALVLGYLLMAAGVAGLNAAGLHGALFAAAAYGCGFGAVIPATNLCVAEISASRRAASLNLMNMGWGGGAILCPLLILAGIHQDRLSAVLYAIAASAFGIAIVFIFAELGIHSDRTGDKASASRPSGTYPIHVPVALAILFYVYVGTENGFSGWAAEEARRVAGSISTTIVPTFFWAALLCGRGVAALFVHRIGENRLVLSGLALSVAGGVLFIYAPNREVIAVAVTLGGFGLSSLYPIFVSWLSRWYGEQARRLGAIMFSLASVGGATVPWMVGFVSQRAHSLRAGLVVPLLGCLAMLALVASLRRHIVG